MLPDDDLLMTAGGTNRIFEMAVRHELTIAQPALSMDSFVPHPGLMRCRGFSLRNTNHLECMSPCIKTSYLKTLLPILEKYVCGWGADRVRALLMQDPPFKAAVIDDPFDEVRIVSALFDNLPKRTLVYGGILSNGKFVGNVQTHLRNGAQFIFCALGTRTPYKSFRKGVGMLLRAFIQPSYRPVRLRRKKPGVNAVGTATDIEVEIKVADVVA